MSSQVPLRPKPRAVAALAGNLVVLEGTDGAGKTALSKALHLSLRSSGLLCERFAFPGDEHGTIGKLVYDFHHRRSEFGVADITPASLQTLHVAAHVDAIQTRILPALQAGACVLLDRFWWSTWAYGRVAGIPEGVLEPLINFERAVWGSTRPAAIVRLVRPTAGGSSKLEDEYDRLADREGRSVRVIRLETATNVEHTLQAMLAAILAKKTSRTRTARRPKKARARQRRHAPRCAQPTRAECAPRDE